MTEPDPAASPRPRKPRYTATVKSVRRLTPRMVRVTFSGEELAGFGWNGPAAHIKLIFGDLNQEPRPPSRTYTPRRFDADTRELDVDFVLHGEGPASNWASQAAVGQQLTIAGPGRNYVVDPGAPWFLLAGDDTAIAALCTIFEALPASIPVQALIEVVDAQEQHDLHAGPNVKIQWLHRGPKLADSGRPLEAAVRAVTLPQGPGRVYVACESDAMRRIRRHLLQERNLDRSQLVTRGYWHLGVTDHPDRDYGEDV
jgi:NADPH-dependent ferric siderophore reductase